MSVGAFSSDSTTRQTSTDNRIAVTDQGVVIANRHSGNRAGNVMLKRGAVLNLTNTGLEADDLSGIAAAIRGQALPTGGVGLPSSGGIGDAINGRVEDQITNGPADADAKKRNWILIGGVIVLALVIIGVIFKRKAA